MFAMSLIVVELMGRWFEGEVQEVHRFENWYVPVIRKRLNNSQDVRMLTVCLLGFFRFNELEQMRCSDLQFASAD